MNRLPLTMHFARQKKKKDDVEEGRKDKIVQGGDDDRELLSVSLTQSEQLYVYASYQSFSSPLSLFFFRFCLFKDCSCRHLCVPYLVLCRTLNHLPNSSLFLSLSLVVVLFLSMIMITKKKKNEFYMTSRYRCQ